MNGLWRLMGRASFWLTWPALFLYLYPSRRTRIVIQSGEGILVVKGWLGSGRWILPGGGLHRGEEAIAGVLREAREETGVVLDGGAVHYLGTFRTNAGLRFTYHAFGIRLTKSPTVQPQKYELIDLAWLSPRELLDGSLLDESSRRTLQAWISRGKF